MRRFRLITPHRSTSGAQYSSNRALKLWISEKVSIYNLMQMDGLDLREESRGYGRVSNDVRRPTSPAGTHALHNTKTRRRVVKDFVVSHNDTGMGGDRRVQGTEKHIPDLDHIIWHQLEALPPIQLVEVQLWVFPETIRPSIVLDLQPEVLGKEPPADREAVLPAGDVFETD